MFSTCAMVKTGKVYENLMINLKPSNEKLKDRCIRIICDIKGITHEDAEDMLNKKNGDMLAVIKELG